MPSSLHITTASIDKMRCTFTVNRPIADGTVRHFTSCDEAKAFPVAAAVLRVPGVAEAILMDRSITVVKRTKAPWSDLEEAIQYAITYAGATSPLAAAAALRRPSSPAANPAMDDDVMYDLVSEIFDREINPAVAGHGGRVDLIDVQDATVIVRMQGGCQGCGMANVTLRQGIEGSLRRALPALKGIEDITDHAAGTNPYFASEKK